MKKGDLEDSEDGNDKNDVKKIYTPYPRRYVMDLFVFELYIHLPRYHGCLLQDEYLGLYQ